MFGIISASSVSAPVAITYVGGISDSVVTANISLTGLTGGIATQPSAGDLVLVAFGQGVDGNNDEIESDPSSKLSISGYTEVANLYGNSGGSDDLWFYAGYKYLTSADTSLTLSSPAPFLLENTAAVAIQVWRNVNSSSPMDVTRTTFTAGETRPTGLSITPVTPGAVIVSAVGIGSDTANAVWSNPSLSNVVSAADNTTTGPDCHVALGSATWTSGTYSVPNWTSSDPDTSYSSAAITMALRPA